MESNTPKKQNLQVVHSNKEVSKILQIGLLENQFPQGVVSKLNLNAALQAALDTLNEFTVKISGSFIFAVSSIINQKYSLLSSEIKDYFDQFKQSNLMSAAAISAKDSQQQQRAAEIKRQIRKMANKDNEGEENDEDSDSDGGKNTKTKGKGRHGRPLRNENIDQVIDEMSNQSIENPRFLAPNDELNVREEIKTPNRRNPFEMNSGLNSYEKELVGGSGNSSGSFRNQIMMSSDKQLSELNERLQQSQSGKTTPIMDRDRFNRQLDRGDMSNNENANYDEYQNNYDNRDQMQILDRGRGYKDNEQETNRRRQADELMRDDDNNDDEKMANDNKKSGQKAPKKISQVEGNRKGQNKDWVIDENINIDEDLDIERMMKEKKDYDSKKRELLSLERGENKGIQSMDTMPHKLLDSLKEIQFSQNQYHQSSKIDLDILQNIQRNFEKFQRSGGFEGLQDSSIPSLKALNNNVSTVNLSTIENNLNNQQSTMEATDLFLNNDISNNEGEQREFINPFNNNQDDFDGNHEKTANFWNSDAKEEGQMQDISQIFNQTDDDIFNTTINSGYVDKPLSKEEQKEFAKYERVYEKIKLNVDAGQKNTGFNTVFKKMRTTHKKGNLLYELLVLGRLNQVNLQQKDPLNFEEIKIVVN